MRPRRPKTQPRQVAGTVSRILNQAGLTPVIEQVKVMQAWERLVGSTLAKHAWLEKLDEGQLVVAVSHPALKQELLLRQDEILKRVSKILPGVSIRGLVIRLRNKPPEPYLPEVTPDDRA